MLSKNPIIIFVYYLLFFVVLACSYLFLLSAMGRQILTKPVSLRLSPSVREKVKAVSDSTGLMQAQVFDLLLQAACKALDEGAEEHSLPLPLHLKMVKK